MRESDKWRAEMNVRMVSLAVLQRLVPEEKLLGTAVNGWLMGPSAECRGKQDKEDIK